MKGPDMRWYHGLSAAGVLALAACGAGMQAHAANETGAAQAQEREPKPSRLDRDTARIRRATNAFHSLDSAVAAGYTRGGGQCLSHPQHGVMGFHHLNRALMDDHLDLDHPEILLYSRGENGAYQLNGVEFIVPYTARAADAHPPRILGQLLQKSDALKLWYLHVWVWTPNPAGLTANYNPAAKC
jgi:hypothetical protein